jgi:hypothetical protein
VKHIIICVALIAATPAHALSPGDCGKEDMVREILKLAEDKVPASFGFNLADELIVQLYLSPSGAWALVNRKIDGTACLVSRGVGWQPESKDSTP